MIEFLGSIDKKITNNFQLKIIGKSTKSSPISKLNQEYRFQAMMKQLWLAAVSSLDTQLAEIDLHIHIL